MTWFGWFLVAWYALNVLLFTVVSALIVAGVLIYGTGSL